MIKFDDGTEFDTSGPLRAEKRSDGWYVIGDGMLCAADSYAHAVAMIVKFKMKRSDP